LIKVVVLLIKYGVESLKWGWYEKERGLLIERVQNWSVGKRIGGGSKLTFSKRVSMAISKVSSKVVFFLFFNV
jgi:hypothetical protein